MKRPVKSNRVGSCMYFVAAVAIALSFFGCTTTRTIPETASVMMPISDEIIDEVGGVEKSPEFQYYISKTITLRVDEGEGATTISGGKVDRHGPFSLGAVNVRIGTPGLVRDYHQREDPLLGHYLMVAFENIEGSPVIPFAKQGYGPNGRYELVYTVSGSDKKIVNYGGLNYIIDFIGKELPCLLVVVEETSTPSGPSRRVPGLTLGGR